MVKIEQIDESLIHKSDDEYTDESNISNDEESDDDLDELEGDFDPSNETLWERFLALKDIIPLDKRISILNKFKSYYNFSVKSSKILGNLIWVVTTSSLLVGLPLALAIEDESRLTMEEKSILAQQSGAQQMLQTDDQSTQQGVR